MDEAVSNPASTGGAGTFFEQHVGAYWLAQLLVGGIPPILVDTTVQEVSFQTEHLGWQADDFLVLCGGSNERARKLIGQVKRSFTVSSKDEECKKTVIDFWRDFNSPERFSPGHDRLVLVTLRGTSTLLRDFSGLLDCARAAPDGEAFARRLETPGFVSSKAVQHCAAVLEVIGLVEDKPITAAAAWPFFCALHVLSLDLNSSTRQTESTIKSLLALTVQDGDSLTGAAVSWDALLALATTAVPEARTLRRADLPVELRRRHGLLGREERHVLHALTEHSSPVLERIRGTIGSFHLPRADVVQQAMAALEGAQVVVVSGPAGSGKSAIAKDLASFLSKEHWVFAFRAEEFAEAHIDRTLQAAQVGMRATELSGVLGSQERAIILVESAERLLERSTRDAFSDLIQLVAKGAPFRLILTCRDYSLDLVFASFLQPQSVVYDNVPVPPLTDEELEEVAQRSPTLRHPLSNPGLRQILRNPYFLDRALQIEWSGRRSPQSEWEFRGLFWRQIVRADHEAGDGMPRRREEVFQSIAVRRARALSEFIPGSDLDPQAVTALRRDSLIASPNDDSTLVATAHDVLEDWAILHWLEEQHAGGERSLEELSEVIGTHPAVRRSYRAWIAELVDRDSAAADRLFRSALSREQGSGQFQDDTLVSLLKAPTAGEFLSRHQPELIADEAALLKRAVHLLRVACVTPVSWFGDVQGHGSVFDVPEGGIWTSVLGLVHSNLDLFSTEDRALLLGLVEDATRGVNWRVAELEGAEFVAGIAYSLLPNDEHYGSEEWRIRVLKVLARIPTGDPERFEALLRGRALADTDEDLSEYSVRSAAFPGRMTGGKRDRTSEQLRTLLFSGSEGLHAARDLPDAVVSVAKEYLLATEDDVSNGEFIGGGLDLGLSFGIRDIDHDFFPPSAVRGLWLSLLRHHPAKARDLLIEVFNHSSEWYAHPRVNDRLEAPWELELGFADGTTRRQWANSRLWQLYRGTSVGPQALQSLLMAFEQWLLEYADSYPAHLDEILVDTLRRSESAMLTGVVASVATAHPHLAGEALLVLLTAPECIRLDQARAAAERSGFSMSDVLGLSRAENAIHEAERKRADRLPHRRAHLESAVLNLQLGPLASRVHEILDRHLATLEKKPEHADSDMWWRLALERMDLRRYTFSVDDAFEPAEPQEATASERRTVSIRLEPEEMAADLQQFVARGQAVQATIGSQLEVLNWGLQAFRREPGARELGRWQEMLQRSQRIDRDFDDPLGTRNAPAFVAAVTIRDHWDAASADERDWCVEVACSEVERTSDIWDFEHRIQRFEMSGDRPSARSLALLVRKSLSETQTLRARRAWAAVVTHPVDEVRWYGAWSIDREFWSDDRALALRCANAIAVNASLIDQGLAIETERPRNERRDFSEIDEEAARAVRQRFWKESGIPDDAYRTFSVSQRAGTEALQKVLAILGHSPAEPASVEVFARASTALVSWWNSDRKREKDTRFEPNRNFNAENAVADLLARFVLRMDRPSARTVVEPLLGEVDSHPNELARFVRNLTGAEDRAPNTAQYWYVWGLFADRVRVAEWRAGLDREHPWGGQLLSAMFLTYGWKEDVRHWRSVQGHADAVHALFESLPATAVLLHDYLRFLYHVGEQSLPDAFVRVAAALRKGDMRAMLTAPDAVFLLEVLLQRHVYGRPLRLKREPDLRKAVLELLDALVEAGSSAAFRMRDDFVTPA